MSSHHPYSSFFGLLLCMLLVVACEPAPTANDGKDTTTTTADSVPNCSTQTVQVDTAQQREALWKSYVQGGKPAQQWPRVSLANLDTAFVLQPAMIEYLDTIGIDTQYGVWLMMALRSGNKVMPQSPTLYLYTRDQKGTILVLDIFASAAIPPATVPLGTAQQELQWASQFVQNYWQNNRAVTEQGKVDSLQLFPRGFKIPSADLFCIASQLAAEEELQAVFVIKPDEQNPTKMRPDVYLRVVSTSGADGGGGPQYFDFIAPCPNACPPPD